MDFLTLDDVGLVASETFVSNFRLFFAPVSTRTESNLAKMNLEPALHRDQRQKHKESVYDAGEDQAGIALITDARGGLARIRLVNSQC